ncbi:uncharacterized protein LOC125509731 [Triticum urartu]|uniref:uncharacterized protein LOC125509731 n=1 Tax=Triticum urartu TaxID=4572 RepID=UPI002044A618|nr:uncharacterized protein LOC125509731 [Triticum urartu]
MNMMHAPPPSPPISPLYTPTTPFPGARHRDVHVRALSFVVSIRPASRVSAPSACMDRRPEGGRARKRAREEPDQAADFPFDEAAAATDAGEAWRRPPGVFQFPWQKCRGGLGVAGGGGWELRDVFFHSLVDGGAAAIGVPGDRLVSPPPPSKQRALFDDVDAWLAAADDGEVDPVWRSAIRGAGPSASAV